MEETTRDDDRRYISIRVPPELYAMADQIRKKRRIKWNDLLNASLEEFVRSSYGKPAFKLRQMDFEFIQRS